MGTAASNLAEGAPAAPDGLEFTPSEGDSTRPPASPSSPQPRALAPPPPPPPPPPSSPLRRALIFVISRYRLALLVALPSAAMVGVRAAIWQAPSSTFASLPGQLDASVVNGFITAAIFVMALLTNGVMADFKETERFPCEMEALFTSLYAQVRMASRVKGFDATPALVALHGILLCAARFLDGSTAYRGATAELTVSEDALLLELDSRGGAGFSAMHLTGLRAKLARSHVVRETSFLLTAYTLTDSIVAIVVTMLVLARQTNEVNGYVQCFVFCYLFFYLGALVRDIDDPLGYQDRHNERCLLSEAPHVMQAWHALTDANSIDFSILFVEFGRQLRADLRARGVDMAALVREKPAAAEPAARSADKVAV